MHTACPVSFPMLHAWAGGILALTCARLAGKTRLHLALPEGETQYRMEPPHAFDILRLAPKQKEEGCGGGKQG
jgi:hypothetical protein